MADRWSKTRGVRKHSDALSVRALVVVVVVVVVVVLTVL